MTLLNLILTTDILSEENKIKLLHNIINIRHSGSKPIRDLITIFLDSEKTIDEDLKLVEEYKEKNNYDFLFFSIKKETKKESIIKQTINIFSWMASPEGHEYWRLTSNNIIKMKHDTI